MDVPRVEEQFNHTKAQSESIRLKR
jgi:hypothetical protein